MALTDAEQRKILLAALVSASLSAAGSLENLRQHRTSFSREDIVMSAQL